MTYSILVASDEDTAYAPLGEGPWDNADNAIRYAHCEVGIRWLVVDDTNSVPIAYGDHRGELSDREETRKQKLEQVIRDTFWMARRYANGRSTHAPFTVNSALETLQDLGVDVDDDHTLEADGNSNQRTLDFRKTEKTYTLVETGKDRQRVNHDVHTIAGEKYVTLEDFLSAIQEVALTPDQKGMLP